MIKARARTPRRPAIKSPYVTFARHHCERHKNIHVHVYIIPSVRYLPRRYVYINIILKTYTRADLIPDSRQQLLYTLYNFPVIIKYFEYPFFFLLSFFFFFSFLNFAFFFSRRFYHKSQYHVWTRTYIARTTGTISMPSDRSRVELIYSRSVAAVLPIQILAFTKSRLASFYAKTSSAFFWRIPRDFIPKSKLFTRR